MAEYIDINELLTVINSNVAQKDKERCVQLLDAILDAPTADVVEVRHGYWIHEPPYVAPNGKYLKASECSNCRALFVSNGNEPHSDHPYCCECGAKMDGERKEQG